MCLAAFQRQRGSSGAIPEGDDLQRCSPQRGFYVLEPLKDPTCSQKCLQELLRTSAGRTTWAGRVGRFPESAEVFSKLGSEDVFLYMGHGQNARKLLKSEVLQMGAVASSAAEPQSVSGHAQPRNGGRYKHIPLQSIIMLMGCSTAKTFHHVPAVCAAPQQISKLRTQTDFEAFGMPLNALIGGAPAMIGALWDVLGGDLEQLVCSLLKAWVVQEAPNKRLRSNDKGRNKDLMGSLIEAREACKLRFLTGGAVVCYGIPV